MTYQAKLIDEGSWCSHRTHWRWHVMQLPNL